jgi:hypothetical protein
MSNNCLFMFWNPQFDNSWFHWWQIHLFLYRALTAVNQDLFLSGLASCRSLEKENKWKRRNSSRTECLVIAMMTQLGQGRNRRSVESMREKGNWWGREDHSVWCRTGRYGLKWSVSECWELSKDGGLNWLSKPFIARKSGLFSRYGN